MLEADADINARDKSECTAIPLAAKEGHKDIVEILTTAGVVVDKRETSCDSYPDIDQTIKMLDDGLE